MQRRGWDDTGGAEEMRPGLGGSGLGRTGKLAEFRLMGETHGGVKWHGSVMSGGARQRR